MSKSGCRMHAHKTPCGTRISAKPNTIATRQYFRSLTFCVNKRSQITIVSRIQPPSPSPHIPRKIVFETIQDGMTSKWYSERRLCGRQMKTRSEGGRMTLHENFRFYYYQFKWKVNNVRSTCSSSTHHSASSASSDSIRTEWLRDAKMTLPFFSSIKSPNNVHCSNTGVHIHQIRRWVTSTEISAALTTHCQLLLHSLVFPPRTERQHVREQSTRTRSLSPILTYTAPKTVLCVCVCVSAIKSLRQLAHYSVFRCKPFNLEPRASTIDRQAKNGKLTPKRWRPFPTSTEHMCARVCVYLCRSNYFWLCRHSVNSFRRRQHLSLAFGISSSISYFSLVWCAPAMYVVLQLTTKISSPTSENTYTRWRGVCSLVLSFSNSREPSGKRNNLIFLWEHFPQCRVFLSFYFFHLHFASHRSPIHTGCAVADLCCSAFYEQWTINAERHSCRLFSAFIFVYVLLHHFNCFRTQATQHNDKKKLRLKIQDGDASEECTSEWSKRKTCEDFLFIQIVLSVFHASRQSLVG